MRHTDVSGLILDNMCVVIIRFFRLVLFVIDTQVHGCVMWYVMRAFWVSVMWCDVMWFDVRVLLVWMFGCGVIIIDIVKYLFYFALVLIKIIRLRH